MNHYGDITKINGFDVPLVDIVTGGSPCQDLSVAGKRAGLDGERSGLFMEQIRIIKEMREHDRTNKGADVDIRFLRPRYMVWENVPGAFSSNKGEDFRCVLEETARIADKNVTIPRLEGASGANQDVSWVTDGALLGDYMMHNFGEFHKDEREFVYLLTSTETQRQKYYLNCSEKPMVEMITKLSWILEMNPNPKYNLSAKACQGILNRANKRGKQLPELLEQALIRQATPSKLGGA